jgi:tRNA G37 N-methylase TrmD
MVTRPRMGVRLPSLALSLLLTLMQTLDQRAVRVTKPTVRRVEIVGDYVLGSGRRARLFLISQQTRVRGLRADKRNRTEEGQSKERFHLNG